MDLYKTKEINKMNIDEIIVLFKSLKPSVFKTMVMRSINKYESTNDLDEVNKQTDYLWAMYERMVSSK